MKRRSLPTPSRSIQSGREAHTSEGLGAQLGAADMQKLTELAEAVDKAIPPRSLKGLFDELTDAAKAVVASDPDLSVRLGPLLAESQGLRFPGHTVDGSIGLFEGGVLAQAASVTNQQAAADHASASVDHEHLTGQAEMSDLLVHDLAVGPSTLRADRNGLGVQTEGVDFLNTSFSDAEASLQSHGHSVRAGVDDVDFHDLSVGGSTFDATREGLSVTTEGVDFVNTRASGFSADARTAGGRFASHSVDEAVLHDVAVGASTFDATREGLAVTSEGVAFKNADLQGFHAAVGNEQTGNGASFDAGRIEAHDLDARGLAFASNGLSTQVTADAVDYRHARFTDAEANAQLGRFGASASVDEATLNELSLGNSQVNLDDVLLAGQASVQDASLVAHDIQGGQADLSWGGQTLIGASGDLRSAYAAEHAEAGWDLRGGRAGASVEGFRHDRSLTDATVNLAGHEIDLPDLAMALQGDAHANVSLFEGAVDAGVNLAGSEISVGDTTLEAPEWAQLGVDASIADRNLDLNIGGHVIDVDEGVRGLFDRVKSWFR